VRRLVLASNNAGKLRELRALLAPLDCEVLAQGGMRVASIDEPHSTFIENALAKARHASNASGLPALADDSGLCCEALNGAPGVRSARLTGDAASASDNNAALLRLLAGQSNRRAHYVCVLVALRAADDPEPLIAEGRWAGEIIDTPHGANGFGYDPHFWLADRNCTAAELEATEKNRISHRGQAMAALASKLRLLWSW